jgi:hypothetical protein
MQKTALSQAELRSSNRASQPDRAELIPQSTVHSAHATPRPRPGPVISCLCVRSLVSYLFSQPRQRARPSSPPVSDHGQASPGVVHGGRSGRGAASSRGRPPGGSCGGARARGGSRSSTSWWRRAGSRLLAAARGGSSRRMAAPLTGGRTYSHRRPDLFSPAAAREAEQDGPRTRLIFLFYIRDPIAFLFCIRDLIAFYLYMAWFKSYKLPNKVSVATSLNTYKLTNTPQNLRLACMR